MTVAQLHERLSAVERAVEGLTQRVDRLPTRRWNATCAGRFANDPVFDEIVRLGAEYRVAQRPKPRGKRAELPPSGIQEG